MSLALSLVELAVLLLPALDPAAPKLPEARKLAGVVADAVELDPEEPITGTKAGDVALELRFVRDESMFRSVDRQGRCLEGDGGKALGILQLQNIARDLACDPSSAARIWLEMAHGSVKRCWDLPPDARLAALVSGNCGHGLQLSRFRMFQARTALMQLLP